MTDDTCSLINQSINLYLYQVIKTHTSTGLIY